MPKDQERITESTYHLPFVVHTLMETMNCTASVSDNSAQIWLPTQTPEATRNELASTLSMPVENIDVSVTRVCGGFGRRLSTDFVVEAVRLSQKMGRPVQVIWTREDEIQQCEFRTFSVHKMRASLGKDKLISGWQHRQAGTSRYAFRRDRDAHESEFFPNAFPAGIIPNLKLEYALAESNLPHSILRGPGHNALSFVIESFFDEMAHVANEYPLDFRSNHYQKIAEFEYDPEEDPPIE